MGIACGRGAEELKLKIAMVTDESGNERERERRGVICRPALSPAVV